MFNNDFPWATAGVWLLTIIFAVVGGAVVVWGDPGALSFESYIKVMGAFVASHAVLGLGRGFVAGKKAEAQAHMATSGVISDEALLYGDLPNDKDMGGAVAKVSPTSPRGV
jgi:hypothetical protein